MLKTVIILCLLAVSNGMRVTELLDTESFGENVKTHLLYIEQTKADIEHKLGILITESIEFYWKTVATLEWMKIIPQNFLLDKLIEGLNKTRANVNVAQAQGKDVEYCFVIAESYHQEIKAMINQELRMCIEFGNEHFLEDFNFATDLGKDGKNAMEQLSHISKSCFFDTRLPTECFESELAKAKVFIKDFYTKYGQRQDNYETTSRNAETFIISCSCEKFKKAEAEIVKMVLFAENCVKDA
ncbi:hypothetical protein KM043_018598 [Ampulex compressa]|nr:hypothetical protein KM043_018598 [Ampulex compressa]